MTSISQQLSTIREIYTLSLEGRTDEEMAHITGLPVHRVSQIRCLVGIKRGRGIDITKQWKRATPSNGRIQLSFSIPREYIADIGLDPEAIINEEKAKFKGKILNKKLVLEFEMVEKVDKKGGK